ncbi:leucine-rich repeat protein [Anaerovorax odorimutans]|uniref:Leucine-rich repeat protein n=1 Tax=Anaerovorax odorimutans TaxID=109327 RepID=A0ABT1RQQ7_9FIRM|nr:leucine-rich repeat protein [Anaerovorax odorimutans]MCQ4637510.1 leucine-rich repeat protein [Anaerovorax odorimutans]
MSGMKRLQAVFLAVCLTLLSVIGTNAVEVHGVVEDTFTAKITNTLPGGQKQMINCTFKILEEPGDSGKGKVQVGNGKDIAIDRSTNGSIEITDEVKDSATDKTYTVESIGDQAFLSCRSLKSTGLGNNSSIKSIGYKAFTDCWNLTSTGLENNSTVKSIGYSAFGLCGCLTSTGLENNSMIESIGDSAFSNCSSLKSTGLENNSTVKSIGIGVFSSCSNLTSTGLENNSTVKSIGLSAFAMCSNLTSTGLENNSTIESIGERAFFQCSSLKTVTLPKDSKVATIGDQAFKDCTELTSFVIKGDKVPAFGANVFEGAASGFAIYYPVHVTNGSVAADPGKQIDNSFAKGTEVTITADSAEGKKFKNWSVDSGNVSLTDRESASTTFAMPEEVVKVTANYENIEYTVTVGGGTGGGKYVMNDTVTITADPAPEGKRFKEWQIVSGKAVLADPAKETTTFTMPAGNVEVKAVYEDIPAGHEGETTPPGNDDSAKPAAPQTSDPSNPGLLLFIMLGAGITAVVSYRTRKKKAQ